MNDGTQELGTLASVHTETPESDLLLKEFKSAPEHLEDLDKHVWRRHLEAVQNLMIDHNLNFVQHKNYARDEALARTDIEINEEADGLTGLRNKNGLARALADLAEQEKRTGVKTRAVFLRADANGLKAITDKLGHKAGDEFLKKFGEAINDVRGSDIAARDGGDEFGVVLMNIDLEGALSFWERFNTKLPEGFSIVGGASVLDLSDIERSMYIVDKVMYEAKRRSKEEGQANCFLTTNEFVPPTLEPNQPTAGTETA
jgi:diguanylate cyclase (GGDEF)-like protein